MTIYQVQVNIDEAIEKEWLAWMRATHIPDVLETGHFLSCRIAVHWEHAEAGRKSYSFIYTCKSATDLQAYLERHAPALRDDHTKRYSGRFSASRQIMDVLDDVMFEG